MMTCGANGSNFRAAARHPPAITTRQPGQSLRASTKLKAATAEAPVVTQVPILQLDAAAAQTFKKRIEEEFGSFSLPEDTRQFEEKSLALLQKELLTPEVEQRLRDIHTNAASPSAMLIKGFPVEDNLPATLTDPPIQKDGVLAEAVVYGLARIWGRAAGLQTVGGPRAVRDLITANNNKFSSSTELVMHRDYGFFTEPCVPDLRLIHCLRPDKLRQVKTLITNNRNIIGNLSQEDVHLLTTVPLAFKDKTGRQSGITKTVIGGSEDMPIISLMDDSFVGEGSHIVAEDPRVSDAYHRIADLAMNLSDSVKLEEGDLLIVHNSRSVHARTPSPVEPDGFGRWLKVTLVVAYDRIDRFVDSTAEMFSQIAK